jgi:hypothetical protein
MGSNGNSRPQGGRTIPYRVVVEKNYVTSFRMVTLQQILEIHVVGMWAGFNWHKQGTTSWDLTIPIMDSPSEKFLVDYLLWATQKTLQ